MQDKPKDAATERPRIGNVARQWWAELENDKGSRAQLRRCSDPTAVFFCAAFHRLARGLGAWSDKQKGTVAAIAGVLAHVKNDDGRRGFAAQMAARKGDRATVSGLRFRRLIQIKERESLYMPLIRVVRLLDGTANVADLAESLYYWGDAKRRDWACDYYATAPEKEP